MFALHKKFIIFFTLAPFLAHWYDSAHTDLPIALPLSVTCPYHSNMASKVLSEAHCHIPVPMSYSVIPKPSLEAGYK